jgi:LEA14-like dessication related protein
MVLGRIVKLGITVVLVVIVLVVGGFLTGVLGVPSVAVDDPGDWGNVSEAETEVVTSINVSNPNPIGVTLGSGVDAEYGVELNGVRLITGQRDRVSIPSGDSTIELVSTVDNDRIVPWWREYVRAGETIELAATGEVRVNAVLSRTLTVGPYEQTLLADEQPVIDAFDGAVSDLEGRYPEDEAISDRVGYEIRDASASWASVSNETTTMDVTFRIHNPGAVPVPLVPDGFRLDARANDVDLFSAQGDALSPESVDGDAVLQPGQQREVTYTVELENDRIDDWFRSHVERDERTELTVTPQLFFEVPGTGTRIAVPPDAAGYSCQFQTGLLVDGQQTQTDCGSGGSVGT